MLTITKRKEGTTPLNKFSEKEEERIKKVKPLRVITEYALYFCALLLLFNARTSGLSPFSFGFLFALVFCEKNAYVLVPIFTISALLISAEFDRTIQALITSVTVASTVFAVKRMGKRVKLWQVLLFGAIAQTTGLYFTLTQNESILLFVLEVILSPLFAYISVCALRLIGEGRTRLRATPSSLGCAGVLLCALFCGTATVVPFGIKLTYALAFFLAGLSKEALSKGASVVCFICAGIGCALTDYSISEIAFLGVVGCVFSAFSDAPRPVAVCAGLMTAVCFTLYLNVPYSYLGLNLIALSVGGIAYCLIPVRALTAVADAFLVSDGSALRSLINGGRERASEEMMKTALVFGEMSRALKRRAELVLGVDEVRAKLDAVCEDCVNCDRSALDELITVTAQKGRASANEVTELIKVDCPRTARLISVADEEVKRLARRVTGEEERALRRKELALQLDSVCEVLNERARETAVGVGFDAMRERALLDELSYCGVPAIEASVQKGGAQKIMLVLSSKGANMAEESAKIAGKLFRSSYSVESVKPTGSGGRVLVVLREKTAYEVVFASSSISKHIEATGDTHSFIRISDTKFMMALCDGMGSGERASRISETAIDLVECFFKAGFDGKFALESVNRFLAMDEEESFATFDVLVCDLNSLERVIIKMGSPPSYIKKRNGVERLDGTSLPLGALKEQTPFIDAGVSEQDETVVFLSDGVTDAVSDEELKNLIDTSTTRSVKKLCDDILTLAKSKTKEIGDDMTVTVARIIKRID